MVRFYKDVVKKGLRTIDEVPEKYRADVQELIESEG